MFDVFAALPAAGAILEESSGVVVDANDRFARLVGRDLAASIGHDLDTLIASAGTFDAVVAALDDHEGDEVLVRRACTGDRTVSIAATRHRSDGEPSLLVLTLVDATAPARVERELSELAQLPEMNPGPVVRLDLDACVLLANPAARAAFGERLQGQSWRDLLREIDPEMWQKILEAHDPVHVDARIGERDYVFAHRRAHDASLVFAFGSDVTAQRRSERLIAEKAAELAEAARFPDMNPGPVLRVDLDGTVLLVNSAARDVFGGELIGADWRTLAGDIDDPTWRSILDARQPIPLEQRVGERDFLFTHRRDHAGRLVFVFGSDITAQRTAERALRRSEKLATLGTLAAGVAHELNNPASTSSRTTAGRCSG